MTNVSQSYDSLKNIILKNEHAIKRLTVDELKLSYAKIINSPRSLYNISSLRDLLVILEKRGVLRSDNVGPIAEIADFIHFDEILSSIELHEHLLRKTQSNPKCNNKIYTSAIPSGKEQSYSAANKLTNENQIPMQPTELSNQTLNNGSKLNRDQSDKMQLVFDLISTEIGKGWKNLARNLKIREGEIDTIDAANGGKDLRSSMIGVLKLFVERNEKSKLQYLLCHALSKTRRNDLRIKVEEIFSRSE